MSTETDSQGRCGLSGTARVRRFFRIVAGRHLPRRSTQENKLRYRACRWCANSVGAINISANLFLMIVKGYLGIVGGSKGLVADAIHSAADLLSSVMLVVGLRVANKPADSRHPYGYGKAEFLVAVIIYTSLMCAGVVILVDAISCIVHRENADPAIATAGAAVVSVVANEMMFRQCICAGTQLGSPSLVANAWEKRSDVLGSIAVLVGILGAKLGCSVLDPIAAGVVGGIILKTSAEMLRDGFARLIDVALDPKVVEEIRRSAANVEGVRAVGQVRSREMGRTVWVDVEVLVDNESRLKLIEHVKEDVRQAIVAALDRPATVVVYLGSAPA